MSEFPAEDGSAKEKHISEATLTELDKRTAPADTTTLAMDKSLEAITPPHDESDYEDNITVTVPPAHLQSGEAFIRDQQQLNGRQGYPGMSTETDTPPKISHHNIQVVSYKV